MHRSFQPLLALRDSCWLDLKPNAPRPYEPATETTATEQRGQVQEIATNAPTIGGSGKIPNVPSQGAEIPRMIGEPLKFQGNRSQHVRPPRNTAVCQCLKHVTVGSGVTD